MVGYVLFLPIDVESTFGPLARHVALDHKPTQTQQDYHEQFISADMHADTLLWQRNILHRSKNGHADIERLIQGNIGLQVFMAVVESPGDVTSNSIADKGAQVTPVAILDKWPVKSIFSYKERALYMAEKLKNAVNKSNGKLILIRTGAELSAFLANRNNNKEMVAAILGMEGAHPTEFDIDNLKDLFNAGYRSMELAHYTDTEFAGSSSGLYKYGLTPKGVRLVEAMNTLGMIIDVSHVSIPAIKDVLKITTSPVYASHTGVYGTCGNARNLPDDILTNIADNEGIIGIGFFKEATCGNTINGIVKAIRYLRDLVGVEHVGLGSGWDIAELPISANQLALLTDALRLEGFTAADISLVMGGNVIRFFQDYLPSVQVRK